MNEKTIIWLLEGDPAIRWQVMRDLLGEPETVWQEEQRKVASEGWGKMLLEKQDADGMWGGRIYSNKWISTTYTLLLLKRMGLPRDNAQVRRGCSLFLEHNIAEDGGINYWKSYKYSETCVTGMTLFMLAYFGMDGAYCRRMADHLLGVQMADGGWNCEQPKGATHGSFHTTITVLEGLLEFQKITDYKKDRIRGAREKAHEFLLLHRLYQSHRTGEPARPVFTLLSFPPRWHYDILRCLDYFQDAGAAYDQRMEDALAILHKKRATGGQWPLQHPHAGRIWFTMETAGKPSRWNTLRALRVLGWAE